MRSIRNGSVKWQYAMGGLIASSPAIDADGTLYVGSDDHYLYAFSAGTPAQFTITPRAGANGDYFTQYTAASRVRRQPVFHRDAETAITPYIWSVDGTVAQTGGTTFTLSNITASHTVLVTFTYSEPEARGDWWMFHHDPQHTGRSPFTGPSTPLLEWKYATGSGIESSPAMGVDGTIYVGSYDNNLYALNPTDGSLKWEYATGGGSIPPRPSVRTARSTSAPTTITLCPQSGGWLAEVDVCHGRADHLGLSGNWRRWDDLCRIL